MLVRSWGARGSIPVSGQPFIRYGGDTPCIELRSSNDDILIVDAGSGVRRLGNALAEEGRQDVTMLFTHSHWDHILGFPFFKPIYHPESRIRVYGCPLKQGNMQTLLGRTMQAPYFPVPMEKLRANVEFQNTCSIDEAQDICGITVQSIPLSHPNLGLGYKFSENGASFVFLTDNELRRQHPGGKTFEEYVDFCRGAELLIHDAEYTEDEYAMKVGWGHSTYMDALDLAVRAGVKQFGLYHHNQDRSDDDVDGLVAACRQKIGELGVDMHCFGVTQSSEMEI